MFFCCAMSMRLRILNLCFFCLELDRLISNRCCLVYFVLMFTCHNLELDQRDDQTFPFDRDHHVGRGPDRLRGEGNRNKHDKPRGTTDSLSAPYSTDILQEAERLKQEGTNHFRSKAWEEALAQYKSALGHLPRREREPPREPVEPPEPSDPEEVGRSTSEALPATPSQPRNEEPPEIIKARAVLNANIGACYVQLVGWLFHVAPSCSHSIRRRGNTKRSSKHAQKVRYRPPRFDQRG